MNVYVFRSEIYHARNKDLILRELKLSVYSDIRKLIKKVGSTRTRRKYMTGLKLADIEVFTNEYAKKRQLVVELADTMRQEMEAVKRKHITELKIRVASAAEKKQELSNVLEANKELFDKPRAHIFNGIKVGFQKQKGTITWDDTDKVVELIKKNFPDLVDTMLKIETSPVKASLEQLSVSDLKSIACTMEGSGDKLLIKPVDVNVDKLVEALLKDESKD